MSVSLLNVARPSKVDDVPELTTKVGPVNSTSFVAVTSSFRRTVALNVDGVAALTVNEGPVN